MAKRSKGQLAQEYQLEKVQRFQFVGLEDIINKNKHHTMTCQCEKLAEVLVMSRHDFEKLQIQSSAVWKSFKLIVGDRIERLSKHII